MRNQISRFLTFYRWLMTNNSLIRFVASPRHVEKNSMANSVDVPSPRPGSRFDDRTQSPRLSRRQRFARYETTSDLERTENMGSSRTTNIVESDSARFQELSTSISRFSTSSPLACHPRIGQNTFRGSAANSPLTPRSRRQSTFVASSRI
jgi:hypothetical protein